MNSCLPSSIALLPFLLGMMLAVPVPQLNAQGDTIGLLQDQWDKTVVISSGHVDFHNNTLYAYTAQVYNADIKEVEKRWKKLMKKRADKVKSKKNDIIAYGVSLPRIFNGPVDIIATFHEMYTISGVEFSVAFTRNENPLDPQELTFAEEEAQKEVYALAVELNRGVVSAELATEEKELKQWQRDLDRLERDSAKLQSTIAKNKERLSDAKEELDILRTELDQLQNEKQALEAEASDDAQKELDKLERDIERAQRKIGKEEERLPQYEKAIEEAENALPALQAEMEKLRAAVQSQMARVDAARRKLRSVQ